MGASTNTEVIDFTGGMNTLHASHLIAKSESQALVNVDIRNGSLLSNPKLRLVDPAMDRYFYQFKSDLLYYNTFRTNALLGNNLYWADGITTGKVLFDGRELALGLPTPATPCTMTAVPGTPPTAAPFGTHTGDFKYTYTFYSRTTNAESAPAPLPSYITVDQQDIQVDGFEPLPPEADAYRVYRIGGYLPRFTMVDQLDVDPATSATASATVDGTTAVGGLDVTISVVDNLAAPVGTYTYTTVAGDTPTMIAVALDALVNAGSVYTSIDTANVLNLTSVGRGVAQNTYVITATSLDTNITIAAIQPSGAIDQTDPLPYLDTLDDTEIDGRLLHSLRAGAPLDGMNDFVEMNGRLFGSRGENLYYSALGNPDAWYINDFFTMPDTITGVAKSPAGLLVFGKRYTYMLVGTAPQNFRLKVISGILGCVARESIAYINENAIWLGETGIYTASGYKIVDLTSDKIEEIAKIQPTSAVVINEVYYVHYIPSLNPSDTLFPSATLFPASAKGTSALDEGIITLDFKRGNKYSYVLYQHDNVTSLGIKDGELHVITVIPNTTFLSCDEPLGCGDSIQCTAAEISKFGDTRERGLTELLYSSPQFIDGSFSTLKQYDKIRINLWGVFDVKVIFSSGEVVLEERITSVFRGNEVDVDGFVLEFEQDDVTLMGIPNNNNSSYSIGFIINGVGVIKSIQYSWKARELSN